MGRLYVLLRRADGRISVGEEMEVNSRVDTEVELSCFGADVEGEFMNVGSDLHSTRTIFGAESMVAGLALPASPGKERSLTDTDI